MILTHNRNTGATIIRFLLGAPPFSHEPPKGAQTPEAANAVRLYFSGILGPEWEDERERHLRELRRYMEKRRWF